MVCGSDACPRISSSAGSDTKKKRGNSSRFFSRYLETRAHISVEVISHFLAFGGGGAAQRHVLCVAIVFLARWPLAGQTKVLISVKAAQKQIVSVACIGVVIGDTGAKELGTAAASSPGTWKQGHESASRPRKNKPCQWEHTGKNSFFSGYLQGRTKQGTYLRRDCELAFYLPFGGTGPEQRHVCVLPSHFCQVVIFHVFSIMGEGCV